jgi:UDP:flavonoid glycosyltransferase YjiC (YdhE family)
MTANAVRIRREARCRKADPSGLKRRRTPSTRDAPSEVLLATWGSGGNLPPLLAAGDQLAQRGFRVSILASAATRGAAARRGWPVEPYARTPDPREDVPFEHDARSLMATAAGIELALDVRDVLRRRRPGLLIADCMLPAAIAAGAATSTPTVSLVHFAYGHARTQMLRGGGAWTTDRARLDATRRHLGLKPTRSNVEAWESADLLLVAAPGWFDTPAAFPEHVVHAGPLGVEVRPAQPAPSGRPVVLLSFSTTPMEHQLTVVQCACDAASTAGVGGVLTVGDAVEVDRLHLPRGIAAATFVDHDRLLPRCAAVLTHGGLGTTLRALAHGKPLLVLPLGRDQHFNARRVAELGAGIALDADTPTTEVAAALSELLADPRYAQAADRAAAAIAHDAPDATAASALARIVRPAAETAMLRA